MFFIYYVVYLLSLPCLAIDVEGIEKAIRSTYIYTPGKIWEDHGSHGAISQLILNNLDAPIDFNRDKLKEYYSSLGHTPYETLYAINLIPDILSKELSQLLGFFISIESHNPSNSIRFFPNIDALNARFELLKQAARSIYDIPGSENIADISFYLSPTKDFSSLEYLKQVALGRFPLSTFLDGGGILAFHDLIHTAQLVLTRDLLQGYGDLVKDFLMFLKFLSYDRH